MKLTRVPSFVLGVALVLGVGASTTRAFAAPTVYSANAPAKLTPGNYILRLRLQSINGSPANSRLIRGVPVVVGIKNGAIALGGRLGPQIAGTISPAGSVAIRGKVGHGPLMELTGGASGQWSMKDATGVVGGEYVLDPITNDAPMNTMAGVGTTSGFSSMTTLGSVVNGIPGSGPVSGGPTVGGNAKFPGQQRGSTANQPGAPPGMGNGPERANLGTGTISGANGGWGDDFMKWLGFGGDGDNSSPMTPINPKTGGDKGGSDTGTKTGGGGKQISNFDDKKGNGNGDSTVDSVVKGAKAAYNCITTVGANCTSNSNPSGNGNGSGTKGGNKGGGDTRDNSGNGPGTVFNPGRAPGGGDGTNDTGGTGGGFGVLHLAAGGGGDNPFEIYTGDVLDTNKLVDGAKGPTRGTGGPAIVH